MYRRHAGASGRRHPGGALVEQYGINLMFTAPTAIRVLGSRTRDLMRDRRPVEPAHALLAGGSLDDAGACEP